MKKLVIVSFMLLFLNSLFSKNEKTVARDKHGYEYEYFKNDHIGLRVYTLKNGLKVYLSKNEDAPEIVTSIAVKAGSNNDPRDNTGLAHYFEHMMFKGTSKIATVDWKEEKLLLDKIEDLFEKHKQEKNPEKKKEIYSEIDKLSYQASKYAIPGEYDKLVSLLGAKGTNAYTSYDETVYLNTIPSNELERWLAIEKERFTDIVLRIFHTELETVYEEFNKSQDSYPHALWNSLMSNSTKGTNYETSIIGKPEHLKNPSIKSIYEFARQYYVPNNIGIVLCGDLDYEKTISLIDSYLGNWKPNDNIPKLEKFNPQKISGINEITDPDMEKVVVTFRVNAGSKEAKYLELCNYILSSKIGLLETDIMKKQTLMYATSDYFELKYFSLVHLFGISRPDQSLEDVKTLLFKEVKKLQNGDFDKDIIPATLNNLKIARSNSYDDNSKNCKKLVDCFINEKPWNEFVDHIDELSKIETKDIVAFAKEHLNEDNCLITYKRKGEKTDIISLEKPNITPVQVNRDSKSVFLSQIESMKNLGDIQPVDADFNLIKKENLDNISWNFVENTRNDLFTLQLEYDLGKDHSKKLGLASDYWTLLGTDKKSVSEIEKDFYKLAINYSINVGDDRTTIRLSGLKENMEEGFKILDDYITNLKSDKEIYQRMVEDILKLREEIKNNPEKIYHHLRSYSLYGGDNPLRDIIPKQELETIDPDELVQIIKDLKNRKFGVYYYGKENDRAKKLVSKYFGSPDKYLDTPDKKEYKEKTPEEVIYFVNKKDMVQAQISEIGILPYKYSVDNSLYSTLINNYFGSGLSSIVFQEIRESRSLAYSSYAYITTPDKKEKPTHFYTFIGTQSDKLLEANDAMHGLLEDMPKSPASFTNAKTNVIKKISAYRLPEKELYPTYKKISRLGLDKAHTVYSCNKLENTSLDDIYSFFNQNVKPAKRNIILLGNKDVLDLEELSKTTGKKVVELDINYLFNY